MADEKISAMPDIGTLHGSDLIPAVRIGDPTNYSATLDEIAAFASGATIPAGTTDDLLGATGTAGAAGLVAVGTGLSLSGGVLAATGGGSGTVTSITAGTGLAGGVITTSGTITLDLATTGALGGVIVGSNISVSGGTISLNSADVAGALGYTPLTDLLASADIWVGNGSGTAAAVGMTGDAALSNAGSLTISKIGGKGVTLGGSLQTTGAFATTFDITGATEVTFPTSGTLATTGGASGIVQPGTLNQVGFYATSGNTLSGSPLLTHSVGTLSLGDTATHAGRLVLNTGTVGGGNVSFTVGSIASGYSIVWPTAPTSSGVLTYSGTTIIGVGFSNGALGVALGGTGLSAFTSGGIVGATGTATLASSVALTPHALTIGGGAGATPYPLASLGTTTTVLHGNASGDPSFAAVALGADVSGTLPTANGGTGSTQGPRANPVLMVGATQTLTADTYIINPFVKYAGTINTAHSVVNAGTETYTVQINGTNVTGLVSIAETLTVSSPGTHAASGANTFAAGAYIGVICSGSGTGFALALDIT